MSQVSAGGAGRRSLQIPLVLAWAVGAAACLAAWAALRDPALAADAPAWLGRAARRLGRGAYSAQTATWTLDAFALRVLVTRILVLGSGACALALMALHRRAVLRALHELFATPMHPLSLGVFRVVVFWQVGSILWLDFIGLISALPDALQYPPLTGVPAIGPLRPFAHWPLHPLGPDEIAAGGAVLRVAAFCGMIGLFSRLSGLVTAIGVGVVWGALQWYGKVDHHHHLLWFALVLSASRCGDALSLDALVQAWRRGGRGQTAPPAPAVRYRVPLAFCWLLIGLIYFFPGFWKISNSGLDWALGENPRYTMYLKWHMIGGWLPWFRFDHHPWLYRAGALGTIAFELSMIFLVVGRRTRLLAAGAGLGFHTMTQLTLQIGFETLRNCYVVFFDWHRITTWIGARLFVRRLTLHFDGRAGAGARLVAVLRAFDWLERIEWIDAARTSAPRPAPSAELAGAPLEGRALARAVAARVPLLWPLLPLLHLPGAGALADRLRPRPVARAPAAPARPARARGGLLAVGLVGSVLVLGAAWTGALRMMDGWPLACYPLFDGIVPDHYDTLRIHLIDEDGSERELGADDYRDVLGNRWNQLLRKIVYNRDQERQLIQLRAVFRVLSEHDERFRSAQGVRFYLVRSYIDPDRWAEPPGEPRLIFEADASALRGSEGS